VVHDIALLALLELPEQMQSLQIEILNRPELLGKLEVVNWTTGVEFGLQFHEGEIAAFINQVTMYFSSILWSTYLLPIHHRSQVSGATKSFIHPRTRTWLQQKAGHLDASHREKAARDMSWELDPTESGLNRTMGILLDHTRIPIDSLSKLSTLLAFPVVIWGLDVYPERSEQSVRPSDSLCLYKLGNGVMPDFCHHRLFHIYIKSASAIDA
jgi:hypothetical protein